MGNQDDIKEFARILDLLVIGRNVASKGHLDAGMVRIACTLAATDLSGLSRKRESLRYALAQRASILRPTSRPKRGFSMLAAFSMGFATMVVLAYVGLVLILPLAQHTGREPTLAEASAGRATLNAFLAAVQRLASPTATLSPASATPEASPTTLPGRTPTPPSTDTEAPPLVPTWTPTPVTPTPWPTLTWTPAAPSTWSPPTQVDYIVTAGGDSGAVQQFSAALPSESGSTSHTIQVVVNIPPAEGNAGRRRVDYSVTCTGAGIEALRWGWWGWPPAELVCGSITTSDGLLWSQNTVYLVIAVPDDGVTSVTYTLTVTVAEYGW
jgi:hypothetical protein